MSRYFKYSIKVLTLAWQLNNAIGKWYNNVILEKTIIKIGK